MDKRTCGHHLHWKRKVRTRNERDARNLRDKGVMRANERGRTSMFHFVFLIFSKYFIHFCKIVKGARKIYTLSKR